MQGSESRQHLAYTQHNNPDFADLKRQELISTVIRTK